MHFVSYFTHLSSIYLLNLCIEELRVAYLAACVALSATKGSSHPSWSAEVPRNDQLLSQ